MYRDSTGIHKKQPAVTFPVFRYIIFRSAAISINVHIVQPIYTRPVSTQQGTGEGTVGDWWGPMGNNRKRNISLVGRYQSRPEPWRCCLLWHSFRTENCKTIRPRCVPEKKLRPEVTCKRADVTFSVSSLNETKDILPYIYIYIYTSIYIYQYIYIYTFIVYTI